MTVEPRVHSAKFIIPSRTSDLLRRQRLVDFIHDHIHLKLTLISATAGYGKTSLVTDFAHDTDYPVAWCHLDESDADLAALVTDLASSLHLAFPAFNSIAPALASQPHAEPRQLATALNREIEAALGDYFVLLLDDFHLIEENAEVILFFDELLRSLPGQAHLVIASRTIPPLRLSTLAARQEVAGLSEENLRFTTGEVKDLLQLRNAQLQDAELERIVAQTEGWITGILLTTHLMWQGLTSRLMDAQRASQPLYEYLADEVLDLQPAELRTFLLESAVLPEMEAPVCDAILGRKDSARFLKQAADHRLFISMVGNDFPTYQYHPLFRDFLISRQRAQDPARLQALQMGAAGWYAANNMPEAAVTFFLLAGAPARAAAIAESNADAMYIGGHHETIQRWAEQLTALVDQTPVLRLALAKVKTDHGKLDEAWDDLARAAEGYRLRTDAVGSLRIDLQRSRICMLRKEYPEALALAQSVIPPARTLGARLQESGALRYAGNCLFILGRLEEAETSFERAQGLLRDTAHRFDRALALNDLALVLRARGQTARAAQCQQEVLMLWRELGSPEALAIALNNIAWDLHLLGQYDAALDTYYQAMEWARRSGVARVEVGILTSQASLLMDLGDTRHAAELCRQALARADGVEDSMVLSGAYVQLARLDRRRGDYVSALEWVRRAALARGQRADDPPAGIAGLRGLILVEQGHVQAGLEVLRRAGTQLEDAGAPVDLAQVRMFQAYAEYRAGDHDAAAWSLAEAFARAEQVGYDRMLVSEALSLEDFLSEFAKRTDVGRQAAGLLARAVKAQTMRDSVDRRGGASVSAEPASHDIRVRALGRSQVFKQDAEIPRAAFTSQRTRELFFFLVDRAPVKRDQVLEVFWPEMPQSRAAANLHQTLYRLRKALGHDVVSLEEQYCLISPDFTIDYDVKNFELKARQALALPRQAYERIGILDSAYKLYGGEYLADLSVDWAQVRRRELAALHLTVLREFVDDLMNLTRYIEARQILERALSIDPDDDQLHTRMLICLARLERQSAVVDHYVRYRDRLRNEFGLDPPESIRALYARLIQ